MDSGRTRVLIRDASYDSIVGVVGEIFDLFPLPYRGKRVLVKPNILSGNPPEKAVTTHPALVRAVVAHLARQGAEVMVGDNPGVFGY
ncbi:MAG: DUF362 domain-containing protein, partial [Spirochaetes bacterium]|nr:DUF362 domain-containing protein [Spirochaetota bacterium]